MNKLIKHISFFLLPVLVIWLIIEMFYRTVPNNYSFKHKQIQSKYDEVEVLIFGDSHTFYGINPDFISANTFNLANISQTIYFDNLLFNKHVNKLENLKYIVLPMEYTTLSQVDNTQEDIWRKYFYANQMELDVPLISNYDLKKYSLALTRKLSKTWKSVKEYKHKSTLVGCDEKGWGNTYLTVIDTTDIDRLAHVISRKHDDGTQDIDANLERIKEMITICKSKNIQVILVNMPLCKEYLDLLNQEEVSKILEASNQLVLDNEHVTLVSLLADKRFSTKDFHDVDHLNIAGAKKCSLIINSVINQN